jgi:hypothetical protein
MNKKIAPALGGVVLLGSLAACGSTHTVFPSSAESASTSYPVSTPSEAPAPAQSSSTAIVTTNKLSTLTCNMVSGKEDSPTGDGKVPTLTPAITVQNTSGSPLNLIQYLGGAVMFDIWYLNSAGGVVSLDDEDPDLASPYDDANMALSPSQTTTFTAQPDPISGQVPDNENETGQGVTACKAMFFADD